MKRILIALTGMLAAIGCSIRPAEKWSEEKAWQWYDSQP